MSMARAIKMTFTLDQGTADRIDRTAERLGIPKSGVVREAVAEYAARAGHVNEGERLRMLRVFGAALSGIPRQSSKATDRELATIRSARRQGGRRTSPSTTTRKTPGSGGSCG